MSDDDLLIDCADTPFKYTENGVLSKITYIKSALVFTSSHTLIKALKDRQGNIIEKQVVHHILDTISIKASKWLNLGEVKNPSREQVENFNSLLKPEMKSM